MSSRLRRVVATATASVVVLALGFVVVVASDSLPGEIGFDPLLDLDVRMDLDLSPVLAWTLLILAAVGLILFLLGMRETTPGRERGQRSLLAVLIGLIVFVALFRWLRPAVDGLLDQGRTTAESVPDALAEGGEGSTSGLLFSVLLAAVLAATLTRIGWAVKGAGLFGEETDDLHRALADAPARPRDDTTLLSLGEDPRSRILDAYHQFESGLAALGRPRLETETTGRHAFGAARDLRLDSDLVGQLVDKHAAARYGETEPAVADADTAEHNSAVLLMRMME